MSNTNASLFERGQAVIPGGVNSPVRAFGSVGGTPYFVERADGPFIYDVEGRRLIDYVQSYGPSILGPAHPDVIEASRDAATRGTGLAHTSDLHRIDPALVKKQIVAAGYRFDGASDALANPDDSHKIKVFDEPIKGHTDEFIYRFVPTSD